MSPDDLWSMRRLAARLEHEAELTRAVGARLVTAGNGVRWQSLAADSMRARLAERRREAERAAEGLEHAAAALRVHAAAVERAVESGAGLGLAALRGLARVLE